MNAQAWAGIVSLVMPLLIAVVQKATWPTSVRRAVMVASAGMVGVLSAMFSGQFAGRTVVECVALALAATSAAYNEFWKPLGIAPAIERATGGGVKPPPQPPAPAS